MSRIKKGGNASWHRFAFWDPLSGLAPDFSEQDLDAYLTHRFLPYRAASGARAFITDHAEAWRGRALGKGTQVVAVSTRMFHSIVEESFRTVLQHRAERALAELEPQFSASQVITGGQIKFCIAVIAAALLMFFEAPYFGGALLSIALFVASVANALFRVVLFCVGSRAAEKEISVPLAVTGDLPIYSVLVPLYREANVVPALVNALRTLDYPVDRLDIKLICEADDAETIEAACNAEALPQFSVIRVPPGTPRTKPRACNYALPFVTGEYTVIYDAEDRPEPDQLRKSVLRFNSLPVSVACLQARLNFYNASENWLTIMFALDYALWFDYMLDGLDRLMIPMPLGGTSNHFRTDALRAIHGWDPYNVTEDADLGIRLARVGLRVRTLDSTTFEEATNSYDAWTRQRSRWLKGYMQTWLVHMRSPRMLLKHAGFWGFVGFQLFIAGTFFSALFNPLLWVLFLISRVSGDGMVVFGHISLAGILLGNGIFASLATLSPYRRGWLALSPYGLTAPAYWLLISCAGARALWQLFTNPWHWEKTAHGLSRKVDQQ